MNEQRLEQVIVDFWEKKFDVLVCTTIVETGIDISNANTLIIDHADRFDSQLHQLRGRVGRGRNGLRLFPLPGRHDTHGDGSRPSDYAGRPHRARRRHAGGYEGPRDPRCGNLLGGQQSGQIEGVGFDLYVRLVGRPSPTSAGGH